MTVAARPRLWLDRGRVRHAIGTDAISNDLAGWIAEDLVAPGLVGAADFESVFVDAVLAADPDPDVAWAAFYRNTLAGRGSPAGTIAGMAPVHARAVALAVGSHAVELGCCFGFLSLRLAAAGFRVTAVDLAPGAARLLAAVAPRLLPELAAPVPPGRARGAGTVAALAGDACAVPLADAGADTVFAVHLLEHLPAERAPLVLAEMLRVARRRAVVAVPFEAEPDPVWGHVRTFDLDALAALGAATGLRHSVSEQHGGWLVLDR